MKIYPGVIDNANLIRVIFMHGTHLKHHGLFGPAPVGLWLGLRQSREVAYRAMSALAGNLPQFEEASRALFAGDTASLSELALAWPGDIRAYVERLAGA